jgi:hypothetical protein
MAFLPGASFVIVICLILLIGLNSVKPKHYDPPRARYGQNGWIGHSKNFDGVTEKEK